MRMRRVAALAVLVGGWAQAQAGTVCQQAGPGVQRCAASAAEAGAPPGRIGPQAVWQRSVLPNVEARMLGWVEYNRSTCVGNSGAWTVDTAPTRGTTRTGIEQLPLNNGDCPGVLFPFNMMYYTWTDTGEANLTDSFSATWRSPSFTNAEQFDITRAHVKVESFDMASGELRLTLVGPSTLTGGVEVSFDGNPVSSAVQAFDARGPGDFSATVDRPALRPSNYNRLVARWKAVDPPLTGRLEPPQPWQVLGTIRYSQYNVPAESACPAATRNVFIVDSLESCNFTASTLRARFATQVNLNGTGNSVAHGTLKAGAATRLGRACMGSFPPGAEVNNSYLQVPDVRGSCNVPLVADTSLAVARGAPIACRRELQLVTGANANFGQRIRHDLCPACAGDFAGTDGHIDHFSGAEACSSNAVGDLGNFWSTVLPAAAQQRRNGQ